MPARFDLGERKEFKFNFHFVFQLGETCKIADAEAAFSWGRLRVFFLEQSQRASFQGKNVSAVSLHSTAQHCRDMYKTQGTTQNI